ncbi:MAG: hypothetical protein ACOC2Q_03410 [Spirochaetota bacterium]
MRSIGARADARRDAAKAVVIRRGGVARATIINLLLLLLFLASPTEAQDDEPSVEALYFGEIGCSHCDTFVEKTVPRSEAEHGIRVSVETEDILKAEGFAACTERLAEMDREFRVFPVLFVGNNAYQGTSTVARGLDEELAYYAEHGGFRPRVPATMDGSLDEPAVEVRADGVLPLLPVLLAGLADGVNPCAFATVVFLLSFLTLVGRTRLQILVTGLVFAGTVFVVYLGIGFGLLSVLREALNYSLLRTVLRIVVTAVTAVLAVLSVRDGILIARGRQSEAVLALSTRAKQRIHRVIRDRVRGGGLVLATMGLAAVVSLLELACTGQLYLPTIAYLVQTDSARPAEIAALVAYNLAFVVPLVAVVLAVYFGVSSERIGRWFSRRAGAAKFGMGTVFVLLAVGIWFV